MQSERGENWRNRVGRQTLCHVCGRDYDRGHHRTKEDEDTCPGLPKPPSDADALSEAALILVRYGIEIKMPWDGDLDDLERSYFDGLAEACRSYAGELHDEAMAWREASPKLYDLWAALCASDDATVRKMAARLFDGGRTPPQHLLKDQSNAE